MRIFGAGNNRVDDVNSVSDSKGGNQSGEMNSRNRGSDTTSVPVGRGADYLAARIKRDRPDIA